MPCRCLTEEELVGMVRRIQGYEHLQRHIIDEIRRWADTVDDIASRDHGLIVEEKIPEPKEPADEQR